MELAKKNMYQIFIVQYISLRCIQFCHISFSTELVKLYVIIIYVHIYMYLSDF
jgi:hypothetical protein